MRKAVGEIITRLKKLPEPGKKTGSFWDFMKSQLLEESEWDQRHIKIIEKEIDVYLSKVDKKTLNEMWKATPQGEEKFDEDKKFDTKEMKADIIDEMVGQVMDRMDDNYSSRDSIYPTVGAESFHDSSTETKSKEDVDDESDPNDFKDDNLDLDDDLFTDDLDDEDDYKF